jgi:hypothetical protein
MNYLSAHYKGIKHNELINNNISPPLPYSLFDKTSGDVAFSGFSGANKK